jgi:hypothetical protein
VRVHVDGDEIVDVEGHGISRVSAASSSAHVRRRSIFA